ncbi:ABC transporter ATP-binding protein [Pseudonocardia sp.]|uniref:ABC transporter ATP-binding protein n=1 Tax=Pseudonocardia sp. TaxID=60912 RepID=UPI0026047C50|nr:ABC transporter ATP-binding protein [Pseudonocardia sp.]
MAVTTDAAALRTGARQRDGAPAPVLEAQDITVRWGGAVAVDACSLRLARGEAVCVLGRNGAGKTSWLSAIAGVAPSTGRVVFDGTPVPPRSAHWLARRGFVMVPEGRQLYGEMSVEENLLLGAYPWSRRVSVIRRSPELANVYELFPRLAERRRQEVVTLSGGEQQMVAMGRALMGRPKVLVMDEPSLGLSPSMIDLTYRILHGLRGEGLSLLLVEESPRRALELCDRGVVLSSGRVIEEAPVEELRRPGVLERLYLA